MKITKQFVSVVLFSVISLSSHAAGGPDAKGKFYGAMKTEYPSWFKESFLDFNEDVAEASKAGKRLMLLFHQDGCPYCNVLVERNLAQKDIEQLVRKNFDVVAMNMWGDREVVSLAGKTYTEKTFAAALKVQFTPTILFFNEQGKVILRLNGYLPPDRFKASLEYVAGKNEKSTSYREYMAKAVPASSSGELNQQAFFKAAPYDLSKKTEGKPYAFFFEQKDCPNCNTLHSRVLIDKETRDVISKFDVVQLDMWSDTSIKLPSGKTMTARELAKQLDIKYAPTIVVFAPDGKEVIRSEAFFKVFHTQGIFDYVSSGSYKTEPSFQRYLADRAKAYQKEGRDVDIWRLADEPAGAGG
jgi:thioredoxin-related protein